MHAASYSVVLPFFVLASDGLWSKREILQARPTYLRIHIFVIGAALVPLFLLSFLPAVFSGVNSCDIYGHCYASVLFSKPAVLQARHTNEYGTIGYLRMLLGWVGCFRFWFVFLSSKEFLNVWGLGARHLKK